jgi:hypothetical protein
MRRGGTQNAKRETSTRLTDNASMQDLIAWIGTLGRGTRIQDLFQVRHFEQMLLNLEFSSLISTTSTTREPPSTVIRHYYRRPSLGRKRKTSLGQECCGDRNGPGCAVQLRSTVMVRSRYVQAN